jgi:hypothetical protein
MDSKLDEMYLNELLSDKDNYLWLDHMTLQDGVTMINNRIKEADLVILDDISFDISEAKFTIKDMYEAAIKHISNLFDIAMEDTHTDTETGYTPEDTMRLAQLKSEYRWIFFDDDEFVTDDFKNNTAEVLPNADILLAYYVLLLKVVFKK